MKKPVIICVDDEPTVLESLKIELKRVLSHECLIETAERGEEALELFTELHRDEYDIALVLADYIMPDIKGDELMARVHAMSPHTLNIMVSGQADLQAVGDAIRNARLYRYIAKPWNPDDLRNTVIEAIQSYLQDRKLESQNAKLQLTNEKLQESIRQLEQAQEVLKRQADQERLVSTITQTIRQSLDLDHILNTTVTEVRQLLQTDRVLIYQMQADYSGVVVVESVGGDWPSLLNQSIYDTCFVNQYAAIYQSGAVGSHADLTAAEVDPCYAQMLASFHAKATLVAPILQRPEQRHGTDPAAPRMLWGLLIAHECRAPRQWQAWEIELIKQLSAQVGIAIQQSQLLQQTQQQAQREQLINRITGAIRNSLDLTTIFWTAIYEIGQLLYADQGVISQYLPCQRCWRNVMAYGQPSRRNQLMGLEFPDEGNVLADQLKQFQVVRLRDASVCEDAINQAFAQRFPGTWLLIPIGLHQDGPIWGALGLTRSQTLPWQDWEVDVARAITDQLAIAIHQSELYHQVQHLNASLEHQVRDRTQQLQQALDFESVLKQITDKVRDSLDERQILQTVVQQLAYSLEVESCDTGLYNLEQQTSTIRYEHLSGELPTALGVVVSMAEFRELYDQILQGWSFQFCWYLTPDNRHALVRPNQTQGAVLVQPLVGDQGVVGDLWLYRSGSLGFEAMEVRLVQQVANQCAIALRQSSLYHTTQIQVDELERLNRLKDEFLNSVSHELRSPMSNITMALNLLESMLRQVDLASCTLQPPLDDPISPATRLNLLSNRDIARYIEVLQLECQRETELINQLLDLARLEAGTVSVNPIEIDLKAWIHHLVDNFGDRFRSQQQQLELEFPEQLPTLVTDISLLEPALRELLHNAWKYTPPGEVITITLQALSAVKPLQTLIITPSEPYPPERFQITVRNSGIELQPEEQRRIFEKFYRCPHYDRWQHGGSGLGLALVQRQIEQLQGTVSVASETGWTAFTLTIPNALRR